MWVGFQLGVQEVTRGDLKPTCSFTGHSDPRRRRKCRRLTLQEPRTAPSERVAIHKRNGQGLALP